MVLIQRYYSFSVDLRGLPGYPPQSEIRNSARKSCLSLAIDGLVWILDTTRR